MDWAGLDFHFNQLGPGASLLKDSSHLKHVREPAFQPVQHPLQPAQGDALLASFQSIERRRGETDLPGELNKGHLAPRLAEERCQLLVQGRCHTGFLPEKLFRMRNVLALQGSGYGIEDSELMERREKPQTCTTGGLIADRCLGNAVGGRLGFPYSAFRHGFSFLDVIQRNKATRVVSLVIPQCLLLVALLTGCATPKQAITGLTEPGSPQCPDCQQLQAENEKQLALLTKEVTHLKINDKLIEQQQTIVQGFQEACEPQKDAVFAAMGGQGRLKVFEVDEAFFYDHHVMISVRLLWLNPDGSGGLGRGLLALDPDKDLEPTGAFMTDRVPVSPQELAQLGNVPGPKLQEEVARLEKRPEKSEGFKMSDDTKNVIIQGGIAVAIGVLSKLLSGDN